MDPAVYGAVGSSIENILKHCRAPLRLAAGANDPMTSLAAMQRVDPAAVVIENAGHSVHVEAPGAPVGVCRERRDLRPAMRLSIFSVQDHHPAAARTRRAALCRGDRAGRAGRAARLRHVLGAPSITSTNTAWCPIRR